MRLREHAGAQVDAGGGLGEARATLEQQPGAAAGFENVAAAAVALHGCKLEVVEHLVIASAALALVPGGKVVVVVAVVHGLLAARS